MDSTLQVLIPWLNGEHGALFRTVLTIPDPFLINLKIQNNQTNLTLVEISAVVKQNLSSSVTPVNEGATGPGGAGARKGFHEKGKK
jgi:hypothetical protein